MSRLWRVAAVAALAGLLAACSLPGLRQTGPRQPGSPTPIADRTIDLDGLCARTEVDGFRERARLRVQANRVTELSWEMTIGRKGSCRFDLAGFRQTRAGPHLELQALDGSGCRLMVWQEPRRVTLAHTGCANRCVPRGIDDQAWPAMFDPRSGRCAQ
ncbi:MAG: hypothetical protein WCY32_07615 [Burkholderiaceae bacterium]